MQEPEFEKQVRARMKELDLRPADAVWAGIEARLDEERRRKTPFFWFLGLGSLLLILGIGYFSLPENSAVREQAGSQTALTNSSPLPVNKNGDKGSASAHDGAGISAVPRNGYSPLIKIPASARAIRVKENIHGEEMRARVIPPHEHGGVKTVETENSVNALSTSVSSQAESENLKPAGPLPEEKSSAPALATTEAASKEKTLENTQAENQAKQLVRPAKNHPLRFRFRLETGISDLFSGITEPVSTINAGYYLPSTYINPSTGYAMAPGYYSYSNNQQSLPARTATGSPAAVHPGFSFAAGLGIEKSFSRSWYFHTGISYQYYSVVLGQSGSGGNLSSSSAGSSTDHFHYTNKYHFLELPFSLGMRFNQKSKMPLQAEMGVSIAELVAADAVHFDYASGNYFSNNSFYNRTQFILTGALLADLGGRKSVWKLGPVVQYGLSNLLAQDGGSAEHLFFGGIRLQLTTGK